MLKLSKNGVALVIIVGAFVSSQAIAKTVIYGKGDSQKNYKWETDDNGYKKLVDTTESEAEVVVKYTPSDNSKLDSFDGTGVDKDFVGFSSFSLMGNLAGGTMNVKADEKTGVVNGEFASVRIISYGDNDAGGAIYNEGEIEKINGSFVMIQFPTPGGYEVKKIFGGAIYNSGNIGDVNADFLSNCIISSGGITQPIFAGGAIDNYGNVGNVKGDFVANYISATGEGLLKGGAINNEGTIASLTGDFRDNYIKGDGGKGGAINNEGTIGSISGDFVGNRAWNGGAIYSTEALDIINSSFEGNGAKKGGAIYATDDVKIVAKDGYEAKISGNHVVDDEGNKKSEAIYLGVKIETQYKHDKFGINAYEDAALVPSLDFEAESGGKIVVDDAINYAPIEHVHGEYLLMGNKYYIDENGGEISEPKKTLTAPAELNIKGDGTGVIALNNEVNGFDINLYAGELAIGRNEENNALVTNPDGYLNNSSFAVLGNATLNTVNGVVGSFKPKAFKVVSGVKLNYQADVDLESKDMDMLDSDSVVIEDGGKVNVSKMNVLRDNTADEEFRISFTTSEALMAAVTTDLTEVNGPIYKYSVKYDNTSGEFVFGQKGEDSGSDDTGGTGGSDGGTGEEAKPDDFNPSLYAASTSGHIIASLQQDILRTVFENLGGVSSNPSGAIDHHEPERGNLWASIFSVNDDIKFDSFETVDSNLTSVIGGFNSNEIAVGNNAVTWGVYAGYVFGEEEYTGNEIEQEGGYIGLNSTFKKENLFIGSTVQTGFMANKAEHTFGNDKYTAHWAGVAVKGSYAYQINDFGNLEPHVYAGYTFVNNDNYESKSGAKIDTKNLHAFEVAPGLRVNYNLTKSWIGFADAKYVFRTDNGGDTTADNIMLPNIGVDNYVEYGLGVKTAIQGNWSLSATLNRRDGGRQGWNGGLSVNYNF